MGLSLAAAALQMPTRTIMTNLRKKTLAGGRGRSLHMVDAVALVHALILRVQVLVFPIQELVLSRH